jgi:hypothetical protein
MAINALIMEAVCTSESSVYYKEIARLNITEGSNLQLYFHLKFKIYR